MSTWFLNNSYGDKTSKADESSHPHYFPKNYFWAKLRVAWAVLP